jgi:hypothetical protein
MAGVQLQFHAEASEMIELAARWAETYGLQLAAEQYFPDYRVVVLQTRDSKEARARLDGVDRIAIGPGDFDLTATTAHQFVTRNTDCLYLDVESPTNYGLRESAIGGATENVDLVRTWRRMIRAMKKPMHKGAVVRSWAAALTLPAHMHSPGAHVLAARGVRMLAVAGGNDYVFDDLVEPLGDR